MNNIKILDCTLRDGGYINNWDFGADTSKEIINFLDKSNIELIEIGFLIDKANSKNQTLFDDFDKINNFIPKNANKNKLLLMLNPKDFKIDKIPNAENSLVKGIRLIFKKEQSKKALEYCKKLKEKNYALFINPTFINQYQKEEFIELIKEINKINPFAFSIVDSMGAMNQKDLSFFFELCDKYLAKDIAICFHPHNNLKQAFSNTQHLIKINKKRKLIIDSSVFGMGRGAGNLNSEVICKFLNENFNKNYNLDFIQKIISKRISLIFNITPWGYSEAYKLSAIYLCHPNYAKYLTDKNIELSKIDLILKSIPENKKCIYDVDLIKKLSEIL